AISKGMKNLDKIAKKGTGNAPEFSETFDNWDDMKDSHKGTVTNFVKDNKPKGSPVPKNWFEKGGSLTIDTMPDGSQIWKYSMDGANVSYVPTLINGEYTKIVQFPDEYIYKGNAVEGLGSFTIPEGFTGNRNTDMKNALEYLSDTFDMDKIPNGFVLHHDINSGAFQLVREDIHNLFSHYGGHYYNNLKIGD
ncbi:MAG: HNH endonuclease, partial [Erysipelothrix sp.]